MTTSRIEVGRGLEGRLTDLVSGRIIRAEIAPRFKAGDIDGGFASGVGAIISVVKGEYNVVEPKKQKAKKKLQGHFVPFCFFS
jgi:uncharacterized protein